MTYDQKTTRRIDATIDALIDHIAENNDLDYDATKKQITNLDLIHSTYDTLIFTCTFNDDVSLDMTITACDFDVTDTPLTVFQNTTESPTPAVILQHDPSATDESHNVPLPAVELQQRTTNAMTRFVQHASDTDKTDYTLIDFTATVLYHDTDKNFIILHVIDHPADDITFRLAATFDDANMLTSLIHYADSLTVMYDMHAPNPPAEY